MSNLYEMIADQCAPLAEETVKQRQTYLRYLEALLAAELEERERHTIALYLALAGLFSGRDAGSLLVGHIEQHSSEYHPFTSRQIDKSPLDP